MDGFDSYGGRKCDDCDVRVRYDECGVRVSSDDCDVCVDSDICVIRDGNKCCACNGVCCICCSGSGLPLVVVPSAARAKNQMLPPYLNPGHGKQYVESDYGTIGIHARDKDNSLLSSFLLPVVRLASPGRVKDSSRVGVVADVI